MSHSEESIELVVERFIAHKRALGRKYVSEERELRLLVRFAAEQDVTRNGRSHWPHRGRLC